MKYLNAEMEVVNFDIEDVIATSTWYEHPPKDDEDDSFGGLM
jgi:hypothetical protein